MSNDHPRFPLTLEKEKKDFRYDGAAPGLLDLNFTPCAAPPVIARDWFDRGRPGFLSFSVGTSTNLCFTGTGSGGHALPGIAGFRVLSHIQIRFRFVLPNDNDPFRRFLFVVAGLPLLDLETASRAALTGIASSPFSRIGPGLHWFSVGIGTSTSTSTFVDPHLLLVDFQRRLCLTSARFRECPDLVTAEIVRLSAPNVLCTRTSNSTTLGNFEDDHLPVWDSDGSDSDEPDSNESDSGNYSPLQLE
jgi:hypothetical protein